MQLVRRGDAAAFEQVYERHATASFSLAYRMTGNRNLAEDVVQEAFLSLWRSGARYDRTRGSVRTWVLGIVHHRAIDGLRLPSFDPLRDLATDPWTTLATLAARLGVEWPWSVEEAKYGRLSDSQSA